MAKIDIYQAVTDRILETLDKGTVPWRHPIKRSGNSGGDGLPRSMSSKKPYRGVNIFLLAMTSWAKGYESAYWLTYKQAKAQGGQVRKGEKASLVIFWKFHAIADLDAVKHWDPNALDHWATTASHGEKLAAQFVLAVWNQWEKWECGRFDVIEAYGVWDAEHWAAFRGWVGKPFTL